MLMVFTTVQQNYFKNTDIRTKFHLSSEKRNPGIVVFVRLFIFVIYWCVYNATPAKYIRKWNCSTSTMRKINGKMKWDEMKEENMNK